jgi:hypothetical protein
MTQSRYSICITELATEMPRCFSISIQSDVAWRVALRAFTLPAIWIAPENSSSFSVSVVLPASGWLMMAKVRRRHSSSSERSIQAVFSCTVQPLRQQVGRGLVAGLVGQREDAARGARHGLVALPPGCAPSPAPWAAWPAHRAARPARELRVRARRRVAQRADALGDRVHRVPQLGVLGHEHRVQRVEHGPGDVPVEVVRRQVQRVGVGQQAGQATGRRCRRWPGRTARL